MYTKNDGTQLSVEDHMAMITQRQQSRGLNTEQTHTVQRNGDVRAHAQEFLTTDE